FAALAAIASYVIVGHRSVYPSQILGVAKTRSLRVPAGTEVGSLEDIQMRPSSHRLYVLLRMRRRAAWRRNTSGRGPAKGDCGEPAAARSAPLPVLRSGLAFSVLSEERERDPLGAQRQLGDSRARRVVDGVGNGGRRRDDRRLADAARAEGTGRRRHLDDD